MKIQGEQIQVVPAERAPDGTKLEPEERPAQRVTAIVAGSQLSTGEPMQPIRTSFAAELTAGEIASGLRGRCALCKHWDNEGWVKLKRKIEFTVDGAGLLNQIRGHLLGSGNADLVDKHMGLDGELDVEHALMSLGLCRPLTEIYTAHAREFSPSICHPDGGCPTYAGPNGELLVFFKARDPEAERAGAQGYDAIMRMATGEAEGLITPEAQADQAAKQAPVETAPLNVTTEKEK